MNTLQLHHIANNLPYELKVMRQDNSTILEVIGVENKSYIFKGLKYGNISSKFNKPIMHHISSLTKPVRLKGYDVKQIPILLLAKISMPEEEWFLVEGVAVNTDREKRFYFDDRDFVCEIKYSRYWIESRVYEQQSLFNFLDQHHFNYRGIPDNLVEYITDEFNPYV